jgi:hypothetical protein
MISGYACTYAHIRSYIHVHTCVRAYIFYLRTCTTCIHNIHIHTYIYYITVHYITLHYITLHYITLHYITLNQRSHTNDYDSV